MQANDRKRNTMHFPMQIRDCEVSLTEAYVIKQVNLSLNLKSKPKTFRVISKNIHKPGIVFW